MKLQPLSSFPLVGCDTFVAFPPATAEGMIVFGKNSDRPAGEGQSIRRYPRIQYNGEADGATVKCTYISIPQVPETNAVLLSQIDWMWGAEMGANEYNVVIGNEAIWTKDDASGQPKYLLGMDLVRLGLERGKTAHHAMMIMTNLLEQHGQGGACAENDSSFTYHNSYLIVDSKEAWVLETSGRHWVAQRITEGVRNISNCLSIRSDFDLCSAGIEQYARDKGYWKPSSDESFDFLQAFCCGSVQEETRDYRFCGGKRLLEKYSNNSKDAGGSTPLDRDAMISILRDHSSGICMHGGFETTSSWVSEIYMNGSSNGGSGGGASARASARHWVTGQPYPCRSVFIEQAVVVATEEDPVDKK